MPRHGHLAVWLMLNGVELERVVRLESLERLRDPLTVSRWVLPSRWPLSDASDASTAQRGFVADFLNGLLEQADYRRFSGAVAKALDGPIQP